MRVLPGISIVPIQFKHRERVLLEAAAERSALKLSTWIREAALRQARADLDGAEKRRRKGA